MALTKLGFVGICSLWPYNNPIWVISHGLPITIPCCSHGTGSGRCCSLSQCPSHLFRRTNPKRNLGSLFLSVLEIWWGGGTKSFASGPAGWWFLWHLWRSEIWFLTNIPSYSWAVWEQLLLLPLCSSESSWLGFVGFSPPGMLCEQRILHRYRDLTSRWKNRALSPEYSVIPDIWTSFVRQSDIILKEGKCFPKDRLCSLKNTSDIITLHRFLVGNKQSLKTARAVKIYGIKIYSVKIFIP